MVPVFGRGKGLAAGLWFSSGAKRAEKSGAGGALSGVSAGKRKAYGEGAPGERCAAAAVGDKEPPRV